mmetsp:Transcript_93898/g.176500  ORF Transcript_93898/g.176500 Transcript_93898/m.176500 type:complete len:661 (+) Transcript_93898:2-1984(+)
MEVLQTPTAEVPRLPKLISNHLAKNSIPAEVVYTPAGQSTESASEAAAALGIDQTLVVKSIIFMTAHGSPVNVLVPGSMFVKKNLLEGLLNSTVRVATVAEVEALTGQPLGCTSPFGFLADHPLKTYMDIALFKKERPVFTGSGMHGVHIKIHAADLQHACNATIGFLTRTPTSKESSHEEKADSLPSPELPQLLTIVRDASGLAALSDAMDSAIASREHVGLDAEWVPRDLRYVTDDEKPPPIVLLQLATRSNVFVVDFLAILKKRAWRDKLQSCLCTLLSSSACSKLIFSAYEDLARLESVLPGTTKGAQNIFDLQVAASQAFGRKQGQPVSLSAACEKFLGLHLRKLHQDSDWAVRPLSSAQLRYAALDAVVLLQLFEALDANMLQPVAPTLMKKVRQRAKQHSKGKQSNRRRPSTGRSLRATKSSPPPAGSESLQKHDGSTLKLQLGGLKRLLESHLGNPIGKQHEALELCAGSPVEGRRLRATANSISLWADGAASIFLNTANNASIFWREPSGQFEGQVLFSWRSGPPSRISESRIVRHLLAPHARVLLFCRRMQNQQFRFFGELSAVAVACPSGETAGALASNRPPGMPVWRTTPEVSPHIIWRLNSADLLLAKWKGRMIAVSSIDTERPSQFVDREPEDARQPAGLATRERK